MLAPGLRPAPHHPLGPLSNTQRNVETRVRWTNDLLDGSGNFVPHMLKEALDQTLPWANPAVR